MQCVTLLLINVDTGLQELYLPLYAGTGNTLYNVMGVKRQIMPVDLPESESIIGAEINLTVCAVNIGVLCWNLAESKSVCEDVHFKALS